MLSCNESIRFHPFGKHKKGLDYAHFFFIARFALESVRALSFPDIIDVSWDQDLSIPGRSLKNNGRHKCTYCEHSNSSLDQPILSAFFPFHSPFSSTFLAFSSDYTSSPLSISLNIFAAFVVLVVVVVVVVLLCKEHHSFVLHLQVTRDSACSPTPLGRKHLERSKQTLHFSMHSRPDSNLNSQRWFIWFLSRSHCLALPVLRKMISDESKRSCGQSTVFGQLLSSASQPPFTLSPPPPTPVNVFNSMFVRTVSRTLLFIVSQLSS